MAPLENPLPAFQRIVTTHNAEGKAIVDTSIDTNPPTSRVDNGTAVFCLGYTTTEFPVDLNNGKDTDVYQSFLAKPPGIVQPTGTVLRIVDIAPGQTSPMHRTVSLDYGVVMLGQIELLLDSGETRLMKPGDICVQRGTMHAWRNVSQTEWGRMLYVLQPSKPVVVGDKTLGEDYGTMEGVPPSGSS